MIGHHPLYCEAKGTGTGVCWCWLRQPHHVLPVTTCGNALPKGES